MSIYDSHNHPYVYMGVHKETNQFYIGVRYANKLPAHLDFGIKYRTSSKQVQDLGFDNFVWTIVAEFFTTDAKEESFWFEQDLIRENLKDSLCLNRQFVDRSLGHKLFNNLGYEATDEHKAKISKALTGVKKSPASVKKTADSQRGRKMTPEQCKNISEGHKGITFPNRTEEHKAKGAAHLRSLLAKKTPEEKAEQLAKMSDSNVGRVKSQETIDKLSNALKGKVRSQKHCDSLSAAKSGIVPSHCNTPEARAKAAKNTQKPVSCNGMIFESSKDAGLYLGMDPGLVAKRVRSPEDRYKDWFYIPKVKKV